MTGRTRVLLAVTAGLTAFLASRLMVGFFLSVYACPAPDAWWPGWATWCSDDGAEGLARTLIRVGWDGALPLLIGAGIFALVGWGPRLR